jgi:hypothetical protein
MYLSVQLSVGDTEAKDCVQSLEHLLRARIKPTSVSEWFTNSVPSSYRLTYWPRYKLAYPKTTDTSKEKKQAERLIDFDREHAAPGGRVLEDAMY